MGFLPGFEDDVFISYAHNDNERLGKKEEHAWVEQFHLDLASRIKTHLNQPPQLWRDPDLKGNEVFDEKIANRLARSATLLTVLSDNYLERPYCQLEVKVFCEKAGQDLRVGEKCRIFKVELRPVTRNKLPPEFEGTGMYVFHRPNADRELHPCVFPDEDAPYCEQLDSLARDIADTLRWMQRGAQCGAEVSSDAGTVYLAQSGSDQREARDRIRRDLQDRKITVLPGGDLPTEGGEFERKVREYLSRSDMSVHIFGVNSGFVPEGLQKGITQLQHDLALERAKDPDFHRILWWPSELASAKGDQLKYLRDLESDGDAEILTGKLGDLKDAVEKTLKKIRDEREQRSRSKPADASPEEPAHLTTLSADGAAMVYLICEQRDLQSPTLLELEDFLFSQHCEARKSLPAESPEEARNLHEAYLQECDAYLIYYGVASEGWVNTKLSDCKKIGSKRPAPFRSTAVYVAPPLNELKSRYRTLFAQHVIPGGAEFSAQQLSAFLAPLQRQ